MSTEKEAVKRLVEHFKGQTSTAKALGVSQPAVSQWLSGACQVSPANAFVAEERCGGVVKAWELCSQIPKPEPQQMAS